MCPYPAGAPCAKLAAIGTLAIADDAKNTLSFFNQLIPCPHFCLRYSLQPERYSPLAKMASLPYSEAYNQGALHQSGQGVIVDATDMQPSLRQPSEQSLVTHGRCVPDDGRD
jgi:hypothetical protein